MVRPFFSSSSEILDDEVVQFPTDLIESLRSGVVLCKYVVVSPFDRKTKYTFGHSD